MVLTNVSKIAEIPRNFAEISLTGSPRHDMHMLPKIVHLPEKFRGNFGEIVEMLHLPIISWKFRKFRGNFDGNLIILSIFHLLTDIFFFPSFFKVLGIFYFELVDSKLDCVHLKIICDFNI